ncbi:FusB/FusC family EF-G-binding protein [Paenibacillus ginsengarvi]|uniref:Elongation factor G-binding protein n=1 Tax=Paenibacillus ginsengarvi TaxID=400777 RepID=A0A3B0AVW2_9BACL|nr:FusB/FusC family EF-G-binding protein [Paenibacillus ginsengarvi]RKN64448.1 elongation factor G-binding protein [Paenibacillus ginsengarvi]
MNVPFIRNHQYNLIRKQARMLLNACNTVSDPKVVEAVRAGALSAIVEAFPQATEIQKQALECITELRNAEDYERYMFSLAPYMAEFEPVTEQQLRKLFPKTKKLKLPDLAAIDNRYVTYVGWTDIATNKLFIVYRLNGQLVGIEGRYTPLNKKGVCFLCNRHEEVAMVSAMTRKRPANASPDYYQSIGNYMCVGSETCNSNITDVASLEKFIQAVLG